MIRAFRAVGHLALLLLRWLSGDLQRGGGWIIAVGSGMVAFDCIEIMVIRIIMASSDSAPKLPQDIHHLMNFSILLGGRQLPLTKVFLQNHL
jgi:hypothetical protein